MLLVDAGNTFIKWAMTHPDQSFSAESISWKEFGAVRHHELSSLKDTWQALHRESPFERVIISNVAGQNLGNTLFDFLKTLEPRPHLRWLASKIPIWIFANSEATVLRPWSVPELYIPISR